MPGTLLIASDVLCHLILINILSWYYYCPHLAEEKTEATKRLMRDFLDRPVVMTLHFQYRSGRFDPWSGNQDPMCHGEWPIKKGGRVGHELA